MNVEPKSLKTDTEAIKHCNMGLHDSRSAFTTLLKSYNIPDQN